MSPTIVEYADGSIHVVLGAGGGSRIITANIQNLWHILDQNMTAG
jgi:gamma-glutamyltranspeptidase/glutathione hydrolase